VGSGGTLARESATSNSGLHSVRLVERTRWARRTATTGDAHEPVCCLSDVMSIPEDDPLQSVSCRSCAPRNEPKENRRGRCRSATRDSCRAYRQWQLCVRITFYSVQVHSTIPSHPCRACHFACVRRRVSLFLSLSFVLMGSPSWRSSLRSTAGR